MLDRVVFYDGSSVQVDLLGFADGTQRIRIYVWASEHEDEWPYEKDCDSLEEALAQMHPFYEECRAKW
jgi:hypothetical protein